MAFSVNTNANAFAALRTLTRTNTALEEVQRRITTGLKVSSAKDGAADFAIAQNLRADLAGLNAVDGSLDRAQSEADVALAAGEAVSDLLIELRELAVAGADQGLDSTSRRALNDEFLQIRDQINSIVNEANFNGRNLLTGDNLVAITNDTGTSTISSNFGNLTTSSLSLASSNLLTGASSQASASANAVSAIDAALATVNSTLSEIGAVSRRLEIQQTFSRRLSDAITTGIGNIIDANLAEEAARLQALQVQQQLGLQALSIANQGPSAILSLFN